MFRLSRPNQGDSFGEPILIKLNTRGDIINFQHDAYVLFLPHELSGQISDKSGFEHSVVYEHVVVQAVELARQRVFEYLKLNNQWHEEEMPEALLCFDGSALAPNIGTRQPRKQQLWPRRRQLTHRRHRTRQTGRQQLWPRRLSPVVQARTQQKENVGWWAKCEDCGRWRVTHSINWAGRDFHCGDKRLCSQPADTNTRYPDQY